MAVASRTLITVLMSASLVLVAVPATAESFYMEAVDRVEAAGAIEGVVPSYCQDQTYVRLNVSTPEEPLEVPMGLTTSVSSCSTYFEYTAEQAFTLKGTLAIDFAIQCNIGSTTTADGLFSTHRFLVYKNGEQVGETTTYFGTGTQACGPGDTIQVQGEADPGGASFAAGDLLTIQFIFWYNNLPAEASNLVILGADSIITGEGIPSPALGGAPSGDDGAAETIEEVLSGAQASVEHTFDEATNDTYVFNWTTGLDSVDLDYGATVGNGSVAMSVVDGNGTELLNADITADFNATETFTDVAPGDWTITLEYTGFTGSVSIAIIEHEEATSETDTEMNGTSPDPTMSASPTTGLESDSDDEGGSNGIPGFGLVPLVTALGAVLVLRRRF